MKNMPANKKKKIPESISPDELNKTLCRLGVEHRPEWIAVIFFIRNLMIRFSSIELEKKSQLRKQVLEVIEKKDFTPESLDRIIHTMEEAFTCSLQDELGLMKQKLASEQEFTDTLLSQIQLLTDEFRKSMNRRSSDLEDFGKQAVSDIEKKKDPGAIIAYIRGTIREIVTHARKDADSWEYKAKTLERYARYDHLLGSLYNRSWFDEKIHNLTEQARKNNSRLSLLMIDVDHFKSINDTWGHQVGDDVLKALAKLIKEQAEAGSGYPCRYGGEELSIIFPDTDEQLAGVRAEELCREVLGYKFIPRKKDGSLGEAINFSVSVGVAELQQSWDAGRLIGAADKALYYAKESGRNRVVLFSEL